MDESLHIGRFKLVPGKSLYGLIAKLLEKNLAVENALAFFIERRIEVIYGTYYGYKEHG